MVLKNKFEDIAIIADPSTLGVMRKHYHRNCSFACAKEVAKTLTNSDIQTIPEQPVLNTPDRQRAPPHHGRPFIKKIPRTYRITITTAGTPETTPQDPSSPSPHCVDMERQGTRRGPVWGGPAPSTLIVVPVIWAAASLHRKTAVSPSWSVVANSLDGWRSNRTFSITSSAPCRISPSCPGSGFPPAASAHSPDRWRWR